jgi:tRNA(Glu) U13 pseudouridine synthase TruD
MKKEKITPSDFKIRHSPKLSSKGSVRDFLCFPKRLSYAFERDDVNEGRMKMILSFELEKGSYATELVRQIAKLPTADAVEVYS